MSKKIQIPGQPQPPAQAILPPVNVQIERIYAAMPQLAHGVNQLAYMIHNLQSQISELQGANLETAYLIQHLAKAMKVELPSLSDVRREIASDRVAFLKAVRDSEGVDDETKAELNKQIAELEASIEAGGTGVAPSEDNGDAAAE